jgi:hypothetical protein
VRENHFVLAVEFVHEDVDAGAVRRFDDRADDVGLDGELAAATVY